MNNKEIAAKFQLLASLMEMKNENTFKIRSYQNAAQTIKKWPDEMSALTHAQRSDIKGVGNAISDKIEEMLQSGSLSLLEKYKADVPEGVIQMLSLKGFGPKKVKTFWEELQITDIETLYGAALENKLLYLKGFGEKTQKDLIEKIEYYFQSKGYILYSQAEQPANELLTLIQNRFPANKTGFTGEYRRKNAVLTSVDVITDAEDITGLSDIFDEGTAQTAADAISGMFQSKLQVTIYKVAKESYDKKWLETTSGEAFLKMLRYDGSQPVTDERSFFEKSIGYFVEPELREPENEWLLQLKEAPRLIEVSDIKGIIHNHSTYSDGMNTLTEMAEAVRKGGFQYFVISDHSKSAGYANGLDIERVQMQWREIDQLNTSMAPFRIFKGIESDILSDGSLDYPDDVLAGFDVVIASVHSVLNMDENRATSRLIKAIENPYTTMLGHPTGRLLLARKGYPIDHLKVIDACAANNVAIEINANPSRLDLDWKWIQYAVQKNVWISINPDAHNKTAIHDIRHGVNTARKGGLNPANCLCSLDLDKFNLFLIEKKNQKS